MICQIEMGKVFSPPECHRVFRQLTALTSCSAGHASAICHFLMVLCLRTTMPKDYTAGSLMKTHWKRTIVTTKNVPLLAFITLLGANTGLASNVVIDMSQIQDYTQYQMDLQQCEGLAVQNQLDAPQSVQLLVQSAVAPGRKRPKRVRESVSLRRLVVTAAIGAPPAPMPARRLTRL